MKTIQMLMLTLAAAAAAAKADLQMLGRRSVAVSGIASGVATLLTPAIASARTPLPVEPFERKPIDLGKVRIGSTASALATGRTPEQRAAAKVDTYEAVRADVIEPLLAGLRRQDANAIAAVLTPGALVYDAAPAVGRPRLIRGAQACEYLASMPPLEEPRLTLLSLVPEGEWDLTSYLHAELRCDAAGQPSSRAAWLLYRAPGGGWRLDESLFPLEANRAYAMLQPKRNFVGERYFELGLPKS